MKTIDKIDGAIQEQENMISFLDSRDAWYRNSTIGRNNRAKYLYAIEVLENLRKEIVNDD